MQEGLDYPGVSVVFACHDGNGNFVFLQRSANCRDEHGTWDPGAGRVEFGHTVIGTLIKEIEEEYCTEPLHFEFLGFRDVLREHTGKKTHWLAMDFKVRIDRSKARIGEPHKAIALAWFHLNNLPRPMHSQWPVFYGSYKDKLNAPSPG